MNLSGNDKNKITGKKYQPVMSITGLNDQGLKYLVFKDQLLRPFLMDIDVLLANKPTNISCFQLRVQEMAY